MTTTDSRKSIVVGYSSYSHRLSPEAISGIRKQSKAMHADLIYSADFQTGYLSINIYNCCIGLYSLGVTNEIRVSEFSCYPYNVNTFPTVQLLTTDAHHLPTD